MRSLGVSVCSRLRRIGSAAIMIGVCACSEQPQVPIVVEGVYMEALSPQQESAPVFLKLSNNSERSQSLNYVHTPAASYVEIHRTMYLDGEMTMRPVQRVSVQPKQSKVLSSKGYHLMLQGIYDNLAAGDKFDITLEFESGEVVVTQVEVRAKR